MCAKDIATLDPILADDLTYTHSGGRVDNKQAFLKVIAGHESTYLGVDYSGIEVIPAGADAVIVRGRAQIRLLRNTGERPDYPVWFVDVYVKRESRWQMVAWQATRAPEA